MSMYPRYAVPKHTTGAFRMFDDLRRDGGSLSIPSMTVDARLSCDMGRKLTSQMYYLDAKTHINTCICTCTCVYMRFTTIVSQIRASFRHYFGQQREFECSDRMANNMLIDLPPDCAGLTAEVFTSK